MHVSKILLGLFGLLTLSSLLTLVTLPCLWWVKALFLAGTGIYGFTLIWRYGLLRHPNSILRIQSRASQFTLFYPQHSSRAELLGESTLTQQMCILRFKVPGQYFKTSCIIAKDSISRDEYRRLLVALRTMKLHGISRQNALPSAAL